MHPDTKTLLEFLDKNITPKIADIPKLKFSTKTRTLLARLLKEIDDAQQSIPHDFIPIWLPAAHDVIKGHDFTYCDEIIKKHIESMAYYQCVYSFIIQTPHGSTRQVQVAMVHPNNKSRKQVERFFNESIKKIYMWFQVASIHCRSHCAEKLNVYLYFTDLQKLLPTSAEEPIDTIHANTAATTSCRKVAEIHLYRIEEWFKVLIHESFHCLGLDFSEFNHEQTNAAILRLFPVKSDVRLFETYCETWAEIINILFIVHFKSSSTTMEKQIAAAEKMLEREQEFSLFQCAKVLHFNGLTYQELYEKTEAAHRKRSHKYKEKTNILSYYILKSILFFFMNEYIEWCIDNNGQTIHFSKEHEVLQKNLDSYCGFIREHYQNPLFVNSINKLYFWLSSISKTKQKRMEFQTMRMIVFEL